jgi:hypothetical protein
MFKNSKIETSILIGLPLCDVSISKPPTVCRSPQNIFLQSVWFSVIAFL